MNGMIRMNTIILTMASTVNAFFFVSMDSLLSTAVPLPELACTACGF
jgi:hypothetical protein